MQGVTEARQNSWAQVVAATEPGAIAELDATQSNAKASAGLARHGDPGGLDLDEATKKKKKENAEEAEFGVEGRIKHRISTSHEQKYSPVH